MNIDEEKYYVVEGMRKYGGSFIQGLSQALIRADSINTTKIKINWLDEWNKYLEMGKKEIEKHEPKREIIE